MWFNDDLLFSFLPQHSRRRTHAHSALLTSWLLLLGLLSDSLTRDDLMSARSPSSSEWLSSAKICSLCGSPSSLNGIISSVAHSSGSPPPPPDNWGMMSLLLGARTARFKQEQSRRSTPHAGTVRKTTQHARTPSETPPRNQVGRTSPFLPSSSKAPTMSHWEWERHTNTPPPPVWVSGPGNRRSGGRGRRRPQLKLTESHDRKSCEETARNGSPA